VLFLEYLGLLDTEFVLVVFVRVANKSLSDVEVSNTIEVGL
jgi:hypothetical protein